MKKIAILALLAIVSCNQDDSPLEINPPASPEWINVRVRLEVTVGDIYYPNIDAIYTVHGFDTSNTEVWTQDYDYIGPQENDLRIKNGFDHYTIEAKKWGKTVQKVYNQSSLYEIRVTEGRMPVVQVFQTTVQPKRVSSTVSSWTRLVNGQTVTDSTSKSDFQYTNGRLTGMRTYAWSTDAKTFVDQTRSDFLYEGDAVKKIITYDANSSSVSAEDTYTYDVDGNVTHIQHKPSNGVVAEVALVYAGDGRAIMAAYTFSNGASFEYNLVQQFGSNRTDQVTRGDELCSTGKYTYDKNVNPLAHLGYVDYLFRNYSISNRLTENVDYIACAFPTLVAESYTYLYDADGYPLRQETNYKETDGKTTLEYSYVGEE